jgi:hypothetical protein
VNGSYESKSAAWRINVAGGVKWRRLSSAISANLAWRNALAQRLSKKAQCLSAEIGNGWRSGVI